MRTLVMKFGGTSVGMTTGLTQLLSIVLHEHERWDRLVLVVSALEGVTDALLEAAQLAQLSNRRGYRRIVATLRTRHLSLVEHLPLGAQERAVLQADIDRLLFDMLDRCQSMADQPDALIPRAADSIVAVGERLAARIVAALLRQNNIRGVAVDGADILLTDGAHGNAVPDMARSRDRMRATLLPMLERQLVPVITGYIGAAPDGHTTTLGRGGSDYSASVVAVCLDAHEVWIWTDVDGIMSADPREVAQTQVIEHFSYAEAEELACFGARLLHARMIAPLHERRIPVRVRNVFKPQAHGTRIADGAAGVARIKAVTSLHGLGLSAQSPNSAHAVMAVVDETMRHVSGAPIDIVFTAQSASRLFLGFMIPTSAGLDASHALEAALDESPEAAALSGWSMRRITAITLVGTRLGELQSDIGGLIGQLGNVPILALSPGPSGCAFSIVVDAHDADTALAHIHAGLLQLRNASDSVPAPRR